MSLICKKERIICLLLMLFLLIIGSGLNLYAKDFPTSRIELVVPWAPGGSSDVVMRVVAQYLENEIGQNVVVANKPGGGGAVGMQYLRECERNGYFLGQGTTTLYQTAYCVPVPVPIEEFEPIVYIGGDPKALTVRADSPWETLDDFIAAAKKQPGVLANANDSPGGTSHLAILLVEKGTGVELNKIPYDGYAPSVTALLGGHVDSTTVPLTDVAGLAGAGELRILGVMDNDRSYLAPDIPTFIEQGYDVVSSTFKMVIAPKGIPEDRLNILEEALLLALENPQLVEFFHNGGYGLSPKGRLEAQEIYEKEDMVYYNLFEELGMVLHPKS